MQSNYLDVNELKRKLKMNRGNINYRKLKMVN